MRLTLAARGACILLFCAESTFADDEPPALAPPAIEAPAASASGGLPPAIEAAPASKPTAPAASAPTRPVLVVPGVTTPGTVRPRPRTSAPPVETTAPPASALPALIGPEALPATSSSRSRTDTAQARPATRPGRALSLETVPGEDLPERDSDPRTGPGSMTNRNPDRTREPVSAPPSAGRRSGLLGRLFNPPFAGGRSAADSRSGVRVEPRSDPAADAALKRRIERQVRDTVGTRVRSYEVLVVDREVTIRARPARFWQKRSLRHTLESMPGLTGYHAKVEILD
jgi:hypothetical protein